MSPKRRVAVAAARDDAELHRRPGVAWEGYARRPTSETEALERWSHTAAAHQGRLAVAEEAQERAHPRGGCIMMPGRQRGMKLPCPKCNGVMIDRGFGKPPGQCDACRLESARQVSRNYDREGIEVRRELRRKWLAEQRQRLRTVGLGPRMRQLGRPSSMRRRVQRPEPDLLPGGGERGRGNPLDQL